MIYSPRSWPRFGYLSLAQESRRRNAARPGGRSASGAYGLRTNQIAPPNGVRRDNFACRTAGPDDGHRRPSDGPCDEGRMSRRDRTSSNSPTFPPCGQGHRSRTGSALAGRGRPEISLASVPGRVSSRTPSRSSIPNFEPGTRAPWSGFPFRIPGRIGAANVTDCCPTGCTAPQRFRSCSRTSSPVPRSAVLDPGGRPGVCRTGFRSHQPPSDRSGPLGGFPTWKFWTESSGERVVTSGALLLDAQAQLNLAAAGPRQESPTSPDSGTPNPAPAMTLEQKASARALMESARLVPLRALGPGGRLAGFNAAAPGACGCGAVRSGSETAWKPG